MTKKSSTILCVDDEENILSSLKRTLALEDYDVLTATSGQEGLRIFEQQKIDLIICDQRMPNMEGYEVLRIVGEKYPKCVRILLSGYTDFDSLVKTVNKVGIFRFISKPWDNEGLKKIVHSGLEHAKNLQRLPQKGHIIDIIREISESQPRNK